MTPHTDTAREIAGKLSKAQREALALSAEGWGLSFYIPAGAMPHDRRGSIGSPYWAMRKGRETPKAPHWRVTISLQDRGMIRPGDDAEPITPLGQAVIDILLGDSDNG